jgi:class 3 adenylate cyclase
MSTGVLSSHGGGHQRHLAAILCVDIEDHSRLFGLDEEDTDERVERHRREIIVPSIAQHDGRFVKTTGECFLATFDNPLAAVRCAMAIRQILVRRNALLPLQPGLQCRIGIHVFDPDDVSDNGVTLAARLQSLAEPGTVYISGGVYERVKNKAGCGFRSLGVEKLEDMADPVPVYSVLPNRSVAARPARVSWIAYGIAVGLGLAVGGTASWFRLNANNDAPAEKPSTVTMPQRLPPQTTAASVVPPDPPRPAEAPAVMSAPRPAEAPRLPERAAAAVPPPDPPVEPPATTGQAPAQVAVVAVKPLLGLSRAVNPYEVFRECEQCPEMVDLPGGTFTMGSNDDPTEQPVFRVTVPPFALGRRPVTVGEWKRCVTAKACAYEPNGEDDMPVHNISWNDAQQYVAWLSSITGRRYRLPTEAEWEYAARGGTSTKYWWGNQLVADKAN